ncbi:ABC transporter substrate-binding protein [Phyllobacterium sp. 0TCS1.6C]|uniref:ABC transporter substrate-binding protein n=1 Tax=unclassified Phyllobacterium TaxID=2638441 RepID=UPI002264BCF3|nr:MULTISPECIES: ABC transporter substrate-binding protein [unclassified Phyllobacterium]MCX8281117.1 ABC transporter substrate-binding protein [Phyllobacterium sp. 0TCS1.6C]MCX8294596.1 ABC transporter substrate-binding protein [Phyllobacterium sp. 0TCS1.6A]
MMKSLMLASAFAALLLSPVAANAACTAPVISDENLVEKGKLQLSINPTNPPQQFVDKDGKLQGLNVEMAAELSKRLCMPVELVRMDFPAMIPGMAAGRIDGMNTGMFWTEERSKLMYLVPNGRQSVSVVVAPDSATTYSSPEELLGKSSAVEVSTYQMNWLKKFSDESVAKGTTAVEMRTFPTATNVVSALLAGQTDNALLVDSVARDLVSKGRVKEVLSGLGAARTAMSFRNKAVAEAVVKATTEMRADGSYKALFDKFGLTPLNDDEPVEIAGPGPT